MEEIPKSREFSKDEVFAILLVEFVDGKGVLDVIESLLKRELTKEDVIAFDLKCKQMRNGWVKMDYRI